MKTTVLLPLLKCTFGNTLRLVRLSGITGGFERVAGSGKRLEVCTVLLVGLYIIVSVSTPQFKRKNIQKGDRSSRR